MKTQTHWTSWNMHTPNLKPKSTTDKPPLRFRKWNDHAPVDIGDIDDVEEDLDEFDFYHDGRKVAKRVDQLVNAATLVV